MEFDVQNYFKNGKYEVNKTVFEGYNTQIQLKDINSTEDKVNLFINSKIKWNLIKGEFLTLRRIGNSQRNGYEPVTVEVKDVKGNMIPFVQYSISEGEKLSINFDKEAIFQLNEVYIKIKGYSLLEYSLISKLAVGLAVMIVSSVVYQAHINLRQYYINKRDRLDSNCEFIQEEQVSDEDIIEEITSNEDGRYIHFKNKMAFLIINGIAELCGKSAEWNKEMNEIVIRDGEHDEEWI